MSLSVACLTADPGPRVAKLLGQLRDVADEIVVAADSRVDGDHLRHYAAVADRVARFEYTGSARADAWLCAQCRGDWVFRISGDELASPALVAALPELIASRSTQQYWLPMRWLYPDTAHWLDELPWSPDFHNRLVRNDATLWFPGRKHTDAAPVYPGRYLDLPMYHFNLVLLDYRQRAAKVAQYEQAAPGLRGAGGSSINAIYQPEHYARLDPVPVPAGDRAVVDGVGALPSPDGSSSGAAFMSPVAPGSEVERRWDARPISSGAYRAAITQLERDCRMHVGERRGIHVRVENRGDETWPGGLEREPAIRLAHCWRLPGGALLDEGPRSPLPGPVAPGETVIAPVNVLAPAQTGTYILEIDLVHEHVCWFQAPLKVSFTVEAGPREPAPFAAPTIESHRAVTRRSSARPIVSG